MGIRGLCSLFDNNASLSDYYELKNRTVVIDGNNLMHFLYHRDNGVHRIQWIYGGEYSRFAEVTRNYFKDMQACSIVPIVLLDGSHEDINWKLDMLLERRKEHFGRVVRLNESHGFSDDQILPLFAYSVLKDVLRDFGITTIQCDYEADACVANLANRLQCPVMSNDSDFYLANVRFGFIRLDHVGEKLPQRNYLSCKIFYPDLLLKHFPRFSKDVFPLLSVLLKANFSARLNLDRFALLCYLQFKENFLVNRRQEKIIELVSWLQQLGWSQVVQRVQNCADREEWRLITSMIETTPSMVINGGVQPEWLDSAIDVGLIASADESVPVSSFGNLLPNWLLDRSRNGEVESIVLSVLSTRRYFLPMQVENINQASSHESSLFLRRILYAILLSYDSADEDRVWEYHYERATCIEPLYFVAGFGRVPSLNEVRVMSEYLAKFLITRVIGDRKECLSSMPTGFELLIGGIRYWLRNSTVAVPNGFIDAIVTQLMYLCISQKSLTKCLTDKERKFVQTYKNYHSSSKAPYQIEIVHLFSELQSCLLYLEYLNDLLGNPYKKVQMWFRLNGEVLHNLAITRMLAIELLKDTRNLNDLFEQLKCKIVEDI